MGIAEHIEPTQEYCDQVALLIAHRYLAGQVSWPTADAAINYLYPVMLECPVIPECAWDIYEAFDAGEYHPGSPELSDDHVTRTILLAHIDGQRS